MRKIDWTNECDMEEFAFTAKNVVIRIIPRFKIWFTGFFGRKSFEREFMLKNGIKRNSKHANAVMPKFYVVNNKRNDYIANIRDSIILDKHEDYKAMQQALHNAIKEAAYDLDVTVKNLHTQNEILQDQKNKLTTAKRTKNSMNIISYQAAIESQKTAIKANEVRAAVVKSNLAALEAREEKNLKQWQNQVEMIEIAIVRLSEAFEKNITKKVKDDYNFGNFESHLKGYPATVKTIINGEKY